jgi:hypothetical protein
VASFLTSKTVSASRITRTSTFWLSGHLSPFAMWTALPSADYYGDSVTMGLAPVRPSRVPFGVERIECDLGVPFIPFNEVVPHRLASRRWPPAKPNGWPLVALRSRRCSSECAVAPLGIGIQWSRRLARYSVYAGARLLVRLRQQ